MKVIWLISARSSLRAQLAYIAQDNPTAAKRVRNRIHDAVRNLVIFPYAGRVGEVAGTRELLVPRLPFVIIYSLSPDSVVIFRVLHTATNWRGSVQ